MAVTSWPQMLIARSLAWMGRGLRQPIRSAMLARSVEKADLGKAFGFLNGINGAADLVLSVAAGALWNLVSPVAAMGFGAVLCGAAAVALWLRQPKAA